MKGELQAEALADLSTGRLRSRKNELKEALVGNMEDHHRFMIHTHLNHIAMMEDLLSSVEQKIQEKIELHFKEEYELLKTIPSVQDSDGGEHGCLPHGDALLILVGDEPRQQRKCGEEETGNYHTRQ